MFKKNNTPLILLIYRLELSACCMLHPQQLQSYNVIFGNFLT